MWCNSAGSECAVDSGSPECESGRGGVDRVFLLAVPSGSRLKTKEMIECREVNLIQGLISLKAAFALSAAKSNPYQAIFALI